METCKATIVWSDDSKVTFEGSAAFVESQLQKYGDRSALPVQPDDNLVSAFSSNQGSDEKQLVLLKRPRGHHEIATVLAFALTESGLTEFTEEDIKRAYIRAEVRPPKQVSQALRDAKSKFDYIAMGSKRGIYKLTNHGDRTVRFDLPRVNR